MDNQKNITDIVINYGYVSYVRELLLGKELHIVKHYYFSREKIQEFLETPIEEMIEITSISSRSYFGLPSEIRDMERFSSIEKEYFSKENIKNLMQRKYGIDKNRYSNYNEDTDVIDNLINFLEEGILINQKRLIIFEKSRYEKMLKEDNENNEDI
ncbi:hypothetical protein [Fusobacterium sp. PH5-44]|uniref:hypothetical protein n=1 Tax=unclassified Fusobacterium TaxID=2648384 RepID=UPI003D1A17FF